MALSLALGDLEVTTRPRQCGPGRLPEYCCLCYGIDVEAEETGRKSTDCW